MVSYLTYERYISIHALRKEGDKARSYAVMTYGISIHALRKEGDEGAGCAVFQVVHFYPRPPQGGRPPENQGSGRCPEFLSTPSARRATAKTEKNISAFVSL